MWKFIEGYRFLYRINEYAEVQKREKDGSWRSVAQIANTGGNKHGVWATVNLAKYPSGYKRVGVVQLMEGRFVPKRKPGQVYIRKNGQSMDCSARNLLLVSAAEATRRRGGPGRRPVEKIDRDGNVLEVYRSGKEAADANFFHLSTVHKRCKGEVKDPFANTGFTFRYSR